MRIHFGIAPTACLSLLLVAAWGGALAQGKYPDTLIGDAGGLRTRLAGVGLRPELGYTREYTRNASGGTRQGSVNYGELDFKLTLDGQKAFGITGLSAYMHALDTHGADPATLVGDAQGVSNIAAPRRTRLFEAWVQRNFPAQRASILAGRFDLNAEFYRLDASDLFHNSSFGIGPEVSQTGQGGPSIFPESAFGLRGEARVAALVFRAAVLNGVPAAVPRADGGKGLHRPGDGALVVGEVALQLPFNPNADQRTRSRRLRLGRAAHEIERTTKLAIGTWHYTASFEDLARTAPDGSPLRQRGNSGVYLVGEQLVYRDPAQRARRARVFAQIGFGDDRVSRFSSYTGVGMAFIGAFPARRDDELGIALARARNSNAYLEQQRAVGVAPAGAETTLELTYLAALRPWLSMQVSLQRVHRPNTDPALRDATVGQVRVEVAF